MAQQFVRNVLLGLIALTVASSINGLDIKTVSEQPLVVPVQNVVVTTLLLQFPAGDEGTPPHKHSGPVTGYVVRGRFLLQVCSDHC